MRAPPRLFDGVLCAVGRVPNGKAIRADAAGVAVNERGYVTVDRQMRTNVPHIFAIGDIVGQPMLAHKATHEGKVARGSSGRSEGRVRCARDSIGRLHRSGNRLGGCHGGPRRRLRDASSARGCSPGSASGRSLSLNRDEGFTKLLFDPDSHRVVGGGIVGTNAGDLISEVALAIEMGATAADVGLTIHPHPTLSETVAFAAEAFEGTLTDLFIPKK
jgi:dihydrolipoamide dehydrogenase